MSGSNLQLVNNSIAYRFEQIRIDLNSVEIDKMKNLDTSTLSKRFRFDDSR